MHTHTAVTGDSTHETGYGISTGAGTRDETGFHTPAPALLYIPHSIEHREIPHLFGGVEGRGKGQERGEVEVAGRS